MEQMDANKSRVFLSYSRYWYFCQYPNKYSNGRVENEKKYFFQRLIGEYTLNQWQFCYFEWVIQKWMNLILW